MKDTLPKLQKELDRLFSLYVRQRDADEQGLVKCCTCGERRHWRKQHLGHFMVRQHQSTRYDEKNTGVQCVGCNTFHEGRQFEFSKYLDKRYGEGTAEEMLIKSKMTCKRSVFDLKYLIQEMKDKLIANNYEIR